MDNVNYNGSAELFSDADLERFLNETAAQGFQTEEALLELEQAEDEGPGPAPKLARIESQSVSRIVEAALLQKTNTGAKKRTTKRKKKAKMGGNKTIRDLFEQAGIFPAQSRWRKDGGNVLGLEEEEDGDEDLESEEESEEEVEEEAVKKDELPKWDSQHNFVLVPYQQKEESMPWDTDPTKVPDHIKPAIASVSASMSLGETVNLLELSKKCWNLTYNPSQLPAVVFRTRVPWGNATVFRSGRVNICGTQTVDECKEVAKQVVWRIRDAGYPQVNAFSFRIQNITATVKTGLRMKAVDLFNGVKELTRDVVYEPSTGFSGVTIKLEDPPAKLMVFRTGTLVISGGCQNEKQVNRCLELIWPFLFKYSY